MSPVATACNAAYALIRGGYMTRDDLSGLSVRDARDIVVRAQERMEQLEKIAHREKHDRRQADNAKEVIGKAARITARETREGRIATRDIRSSVDVNTLRAAGEEKVYQTPLFAVFGQGLCDSISRMLNSDTAGERINEIEKVVNKLELEEDHAILRKLHYELGELSRRSQHAIRRTTSNKVVPLRTIEREASASLMLPMLPAPAPSMPPGWIQRGGGLFPPRRGRRKCAALRHTLADPLPPCTGGAKI